MTVSDIREIVPGSTMLWIETDNGDCCEADCVTYLSHKYDDKTVITMYPEHYNSIGVTGLTVVIG